MRYLIIFGALCLSGCATSKVDYTPPQPVKVENQVVVQEPFELVWDRLVRNLASDFFVINNIEKSSRIINVSVSSTKPTDFVDCGVSVREFSNAAGKRNYRYDPSESTQYTVANDMGHLFNVSRSGRLEARANIYVAPEGKNTTIVTSNAKYVVDVKMQAWNVYNQPAGADDFSFIFSTKEPYVETTPNGVTCVPRGNLEQRILDYAK